MSTVLLVVFALALLVFYGIFRLFKFLLKKTKSALRDGKNTREYNRAKREVAEFEASIAWTSIVEKRKVFDSNRKYHYETTFMIHFKNGKQAALTVQNGSYHYDVLMSGLRN